MPIGYKYIALFDLWQVFMVKLELQLKHAVLVFCSRSKKLLLQNIGILYDNVNAFQHESINHK